MRMRKFSADDPRVVSIVREHDSTKRKVRALRDAVESRGITLLIGPYKTGKTPLVKECFREAQVVASYTDSYVDENVEWLVRASNGYGKIGEVVIVDEVYPLARLENFLDILNRLSKRTRVVLIAHPQVLDKSDEKHGRIHEAIRELNIPIVKTGFWPDDLMEMACMDGFGFSIEEAQEFTRFSGGLPTIIEAVDLTPEGRKTIRLGGIIRPWEKQLDPMSKESIILLHMLPRTKIGRLIHMLSRTVVGPNPKLEFLRDFGYFSSDGTIRARSLHAYLAISTGDSARIEEIKGEMKHFELQDRY